MFKNETAKAFLGVGWSFPFDLDDGGQAELAAYETDVNQAIRIILGTTPGERVMRQDFGAGLEDFVFEPASATTVERIRVRVEEALIDWEPRIDVIDVKVEIVSPLKRQIDIHIQYRVRSTNSQHNLVYPFFLDEGAPQ